MQVPLPVGSRGGGKSAGSRWLPPLPPPHLPQYGNGQTPAGEDIPGGLRPDASCTIDIKRGQRACTLLFTPTERTQWSISSRDIWTQVSAHVRV